jgi:hypothetical protein
MLNVEIVSDDKLSRTDAIFNKESEIPFAPYQAKDRDTHIVFAGCITADVYCTEWDDERKVLEIAVSFVCGPEPDDDRTKYQVIEDVLLCHGFAIGYKKVIALTTK